MTWGGGPYNDGIQKLSVALSRRTFSGGVSFVRRVNRVATYSSAMSKKASITSRV